MTLPAASAMLQSKNGSYVYKDMVIASIGDLSIVFDGADEDLSDVKFRFRNHFPTRPYGHRNKTDYSHISPESGRTEILSLTIAGRHSHVMYNLYITSSEFRASPRLIFSIKEFNVVSFGDGCHSGGIFIAEELKTVASYCSLAGIAFLNDTSERGGILFGTKSLMVIFKGYSWFARMRIIVYVIYEDCLGVANICDQFDIGRHHLKRCPKSKPSPMICRHLTSQPCLEVTRLPSDRQVAYSQGCQIFFSLRFGHFPEYFHFSNTLFIQAKIKDYLYVTENRSSLEELLPRVHVLWQYEGGTVPFDYFSVSLMHEIKKEFKRKAYSAYVLLSNALPWLGMGYWLRFTETPACQTELLDVHPHHIDIGCGKLRLTSAPQIKISIAPEVFKNYYTFNLASERSPFLNVAFYLSEVKYFVHGRFRVLLEWISNNMEVDKAMIYSKLQYLELKLYCDHQFQKIFITFQLEGTFSQLIVQYMSRALILNHIEELPRTPSWNSTLSLDGKEFCRGPRAPCYKYHSVSNITWNEAQIWCQEQKSNLISINSPNEWHAVLWRVCGINTRNVVPKVNLSGSEIMDGTLLFIGLHRIDVSTSLISVLN